MGNCFFRMMISVRSLTLTDSEVTSAVGQSFEWIETLTNTSLALEPFTPLGLSRSSDLQIL